MREPNANPSNAPPRFCATVVSQCTIAFHSVPPHVNFPGMNLIGWLREKVEELLQLKDTEHSIALGLAIGMFFGFTPLVGFKTLIAIGLARLLRANFLAAAIAVSLHDVFLPLFPFLLRLEYQIGYWLLSNPHQFAPRFRLASHSVSMWFHWSTFFTVGRPLLIGSLFFAVPVGVLTYYIALFLLEQRKRRKEKKTSKPPR
jgi:uncharacterized protein